MHKRSLWIASLIPIMVATAAWCATSANPQEVALPQVTPEMRTYSHIRYFLYFLSTAYSAATFFFLAKTGISARMRDWTEAKVRHPALQFAVYFVLFYVTVVVVTFPLSIFSSFWLEHHFHLTHQGFGSWLLDLLKEEGLGLLLTMPVVGFFFLLVRKFPRRWPILFWLITCAVMAFDTFISPCLLEPALNKFTPLPAGRLHDQIEALATYAGAPQAPILVCDRSKQTDKLNAYVSGLGPSTHVVLWDTTLSKLPEDQILAIVGHELGHYYLKHLWWGFLMGAAGSLLLVPINAYLARPFVARLPKNWKLRGLEDFAVIPVLAFVSVTGMFVLDPVTNAISRYQEHQADAFSLAVTKNGPALARSFVSLSQNNLSEPEPPPFIEFWLFSHPSLKERIDFALGKT